MSDYLFVYGTLRRKSLSEISRRLTQHSVFVGDASYQGKLFMVDDYPGAVPSDDSNDKVHGEVYRLIAPDSVLTLIDEYEECGPGFAEPHEYVRRKEEVICQNSEAILQAWIYIFNRSTNRLPLIQSGDFYNKN